jgi:hypothetical protein
VDDEAALAGGDVGWRNEGVALLRGVGCKNAGVLKGEEVLKGEAGGFVPSFVTGSGSNLPTGSGVLVSCA